jgi:DtxR family Mn-dependent transcriptional regulator
MPALLWISLALIIILTAVFLPKYGVLTRLTEWWLLRQRELVEDALKHLIDLQQQGRHASPESLAGSLELNSKKVIKLVSQMETQKLVEHDGMQIRLTAEGERWALHIVRAHRLWERYLADEARMPLGLIHGEAHRREHSMTDTQLDALDAALGHPATDPHGDPIPSRAGQIRAMEATPLTAWQSEGLVRIAHLEDEPAIAYEQILAAGLRLGQVIRVIERSPERFILSDGESEYRLAPSVAANVHVVALPQSETALQGALPLWQLAHNQKAEILLLDEGVQGFTRRRFLDLGLTPGTLIFPELKNFFGDPRGYRVRGTLIALRKDQAAQIWVKPIEAAAGK